MARIHTWPCLLAHCTHMGSTLLLTLYKEPYPVLWAAQLQKNRGWSGGSTENRDWGGCGGRDAQRQRSACCMQTHPKVYGILALNLPPWVEYKHFHPSNVPLSFFSLTGSRVNLSRAETHWQDNLDKNSMFDFNCSQYLNERMTFSLHNFKFYINRDIKELVKRDNYQNI